jgi:hypothetical protein
MPMTRNLFRLLAPLLLAALLLATAAAAQRPVVPDAHLMVTVQQRQEGTIDRGFHILTLSCLGGHCSLTKVTLNTCGPSGSGVDAFFPGVDYSFTREGNLVVVDHDNTLMVEESGGDIGGRYVNQFRFQYKPPKKGEIIAILTGFTGGFVKTSAILKKTITVDFVPLVGASQVRKLDCGVLLPGVWK